MKNKLKDNTTIKIFSIFAAIILWLYIQMVQNPDIEYTFTNMKVNLVNSALLEDKNLIVMDDGSKNVSDITVKCPRWNLNDLKSDDFVAYVDLSEIRTTGTFELPVKVRLNNDNIIISNKNPSTVSVTVDRVVTVEKDLVVHMSGNLKDGYYTNEKMVVPDRTIFSVKGPESIVNKIYNGVVSVNLNNKSEDFSDTISVILVSEDGTAVTNEKITVLDNNIGVNVSVYKKKLLPIEITGIDEKISYEIRPSRVEIAGPSETIDKMEKIILDDVILNANYSGYSQKLSLKLSENILILDEEAPQVVIK